MTTIRDKKKLPLAVRIVKIMGKIVLAVLLLLIALFLLIQTNPVQNIIREKTISWLEKKLDTKLQLGKLYVRFPQDILIENLYVEDRNHDTLLSAGKIKASISIWQLIKSKVIINDLLLQDITAKVKRELPDTAFNFQFIIDAFKSTPSATQAAHTDTTNNFSLDRISLRNISFLYKDIITGNDLEGHLGQLETTFKELNLARNRFEIKKISIDDLAATLNQSSPLVKPDSILVQASPPATATPPLGIDFREISLERINIDYNDQASALSLHLALDKLLTHSDKIDLPNHIIDLDDFILEGTSASLTNGKQPAPKKKPITAVDKPVAKNPWKINVATLQLDRNRFQYDDDNKSSSKNGFDYAHMNITDLALKAEHFYSGMDSTSGLIRSAAFKEKSGLILNKLETEFKWGNHLAALTNLLLQTPGSEIKNEISIRYASMADMKDHPADMQIRLALAKTNIQVKDILTFVPSLRNQPAFTNPMATWSINCKANGKLADLKIEQLRVSTLTNTILDIDGRLQGLPQVSRINANLVIHNLQTSKADLDVLIPDSLLPKQIAIPARLRMSGTLKGNQENLQARLTFLSSSGNINLQGDGMHLNDKTNAAYQAFVETTDLNAGTILKNKDLPQALNSSFTIKGSGLTKNTADAAIDGIIRSALINNYTYRNLALKGKIAGQQANLQADIHDPNIDLSLTASADLSGQYPGIKLQSTIDSIRTGPLHLTNDNMIYRGTISADFPVTNPDSLRGQLLISHSLLVTDKQRIKMDSIKLTAGQTDSGQYVHLFSDAINASLAGKFRFSELGTILRQSIEPYFSVNNPDSLRLTDAYDFQFDAKISDRPVLRTVLPTLGQFDSLSLASHFTTSAGLQMTINTPFVEIGNNRIRNLAILANSTGKGLQINGEIDEFAQGKNLALFNSTIASTIRNDSIDYNIRLKDRLGKERYTLSGLFKQPEKDTYRFSFTPGSLLLNYEPWDIAPENEIEITPATVTAKQFVLTNNGQKLSINSDTAKRENIPLNLEFLNFKMETLTAFIQSDSTLLGGTLNGKAVATNIIKQPLFTSDLTISNLNIRKDTVGDLKLLVDNKVTDTYHADIAITGRGNDVTIKGNYFTGRTDNQFDFLLNLNKLPLTTVQAFSRGNLTQSSGNLNGNFSVKGTIDQPQVLGDMNFQQAAFKPAALNNRLLIDQDKFTIDQQGITFDQFAIKDSTGNQLILNGKAATKNFRNYNFDFSIRSNNFQALNSTKKDNKLYYGKLFFNSNINVKGTELAPVIDGRITINDKTKLTVVLPQKEPGVASREGVIEFVDPHADISDSLFLKKYDTLNSFAMKGLDLSVNIEIKKEAELSMIVDEGSGDFLNVQGEALLTSGVDPSGKITLAGSYELEEGAYQLTFNLLRRKFNIQKGSKIVWGGEPTEADVNINAAYETNTAPLDLVKNQLGSVSDNERNTYLQKLPFQVFLKMTGKLLQPLISFDIVLPENKEYNVSGDIVATVRTKLEILRLDPGELNKQVFALLLLNRFVGENPFNSSGSGVTAQTLLRQSASKLLTEQLNRLAESLVQGVDLNFDVQSSDDYTTGQRKDRTDLNVGLSKKLLNDRLTVTVGSNFQLEGVQNSNRNSSNIAGDVSLNYRLSKDGRYMLRAYRKNEYQGVLDGYVIETGVGFIITIDYNRFKEIFQQKKKKKAAPNPGGNNQNSPTPGPVKNLP